MKYIPPIGGAANDPYVDGNPGTGVGGSPVPAAAIEHAMREIAHVITFAGLTPTDVDLTQLRQAIQAMSTTTPDATTSVKGKVELATSAEALGGTDSTRAVTSSGLASSKTLSANGYYTLPGGLILQWGSSTPGSLGNGANTTVTFPLTFPNNCYQVIAGSTWGNVGGSAGAEGCNVESITTANFVFHSEWNSSTVNSTNAIRYFAIGN